MSPLWRSSLTAQWQLWECGLQTSNYRELNRSRAPAAVLWHPPWHVPEVTFPIGCSWPVTKCGKYTKSGLSLEKQDSNGFGSRTPWWPCLKLSWTLPNPPFFSFTRGQTCMNNMTTLSLLQLPPHFLAWAFPPNKILAHCALKNNTGRPQRYRRLGSTPLQ